LKDLLDFVPPGSIHWGPWDIYQHLSNYDDVGFSPSIFAYVNYFSGQPRSKNLHLGVVPSFVGKGPGRPILGGVGLGIAHTCTHIQEAVEFGRFLMSEETQSEIFPVASGQPATSAVWNDPAINKRLNNFYLTLKENMKSAYIRPRFPVFHALELRNGRILQQWWEDKLTIDEVIKLLNSLQLVDDFEDMGDAKGVL
jgi:multiple sugar transport system substrate-binding protein